MESDKDINRRSSAATHNMEERRQFWTTEETEFLFGMYNKNLNNVGAGKKYRTKFHLWNKIALRLNKQFKLQRTTIQCIGRYNTITQNPNRHSQLNFNKVDQDLSSSAEELDEDDHDDDETLQDDVDTISKVIRTTLLEIHELKEEAKERRHRERMQLMQQILQGQTNVTQPNAVVVIEPHAMEKRTENNPQMTRARLLEMQRIKMMDRERKHKLLQANKQEQQNLNA